MVPLSSDYFGTGETIDGFDADLNALVGVTEDGDGAIERGSRDISGNFELDSNQTPFMYGVSKIVRKAGTSANQRENSLLYLTTLFTNHLAIISLTNLTLV